MRAAQAGDALQVRGDVVRVTRQVAYVRVDRRATPTASSSRRRRAPACSAAATRDRRPRDPHGRGRRRRARPRPPQQTDPLRVGARDRRVRGRLPALRLAPDASHGNLRDGPPQRQGHRLGREVPRHLLGARDPAPVPARRLVHGVHEHLLRDDPLRDAAAGPRVDVPAGAGALRTVAQHPDHHVRAGVPDVLRSTR